MSLPPSALLVVDTFVRSLDTHIFLCMALKEPCVG